MSEFTTCVDARYNGGKMDIGRWATSNAMTMTANVIGSGLEQLVILTTDIFVMYSSAFVSY
jgi:hypothetical protein